MTAFRRLKQIFKCQTPEGSQSSRMESKLIIGDYALLQFSVDVRRVGSRN